MSYSAAVASLFSLAPELAPGQPKARRKFDLEHMRVLADALGHPERRFHCVLIAGTNGKGSTSATLASILGCSGYSTGLYTSPHLVRPNERIRINSASGGEEISDAEFAEVHARVDGIATQLISGGKLPQHPSFFEMLTAMAFEFFASVGVEVAVLEVGIGGRLDATNIADPLLSVVADVDYDHMEWLGDTLPEIAREKAGIIRENGVLVTLPQHPQVTNAIGEIATAKNARGVNAAEYLPPMTPNSDEFISFAGERPLNRYPVEVLGERIMVESPLVGRHQTRNLALAIAAAEQLRTSFGFGKITVQTIARGIRETEWPGRFQVLPATAERPQIILDVAHNPAGAWALRAALSAGYGDRPLTFVFGAMRDKAIGEITSILFPLAEKVVATQVANPRAATPQEIGAAAASTGVPVLTADTPVEALRLAIAETAPDGVIVISGSVYLVGAMLRELTL